MATSKSKSTSKSVQKVKYTRKGEKVGSFSVSKKSGSDHGLIAQWTHPKYSQAEGYEYDWEYLVGSKWLPGTNGTIDVEQAKVDKKNKKNYWFRHEWNAPSDAVAARCRVRPVSKTKTTTSSTSSSTNRSNKDNTSSKSSSKSTSTTYMYFSASWSSYSTHDFRNDKLPTPTVTVDMDSDGAKATVTVKCDDEDCNLCTVQAEVRNGKDKAGNWKYAAKKKWANKPCKDGEFSGEFSVTAGETWYFKALCKTTKKNSKGNSNWSARVAGVAKPATPAISAAKATGDDSAKVTWAAASGAKTYTVEYCMDGNYFKTNPEAVRSASGIVGTKFTPTGLESGHKWYFRVQAVNDAGESGWSGVKSCVLATVPEAPTTYETEPAFMRGDSVRLRWTHNSEDESEQTAFEVVMNGTTFSGTTDDFYVRPLSSYADGTQVTWKVRTKGAHASWSPWSVVRSFYVYEQASLTCAARQTDSSGATVDEDSPLTAFPLAVVLDAAGGGRQVAGYHVSIVAAEPLSYVDGFGYERVMGVGEVAFERDYAVTSDPYTAVITTGDGANLRDAGVYEIVADVAMKSGLRATADAWRFAVDFDVEVPEPNVLVSFDAEDLTAGIMPACYEIDENGDATTELAAGVTLAVYRIDDDGTLVLLRSGIPNDGTAVVVDPHANFGECWYHVVATDTATGVCSFADGGAASPHHTTTVQWDESWQQAIDPDDLGERDYDYAGMRMDGLYNAKHDESGSVQAEDVEYIGREHPVSYYGTQMGYEAQFQVDFPYDDMETLKKARRLLALRDDAYVREPRGTGYWAHIVNPRLSRSSDSLKITLSFTARRVDRDDSPVEED